MIQYHKIIIYNIWCLASALIMNTLTESHINLRRNQMTWPTDQPSVENLKIHEVHLPQTVSSTWLSLRGAVVYCSHVHPISIISFILVSTHIVSMHKNKSKTALGFTGCCHFSGSQPSAWLRMHHQSTPPQVASNQSFWVRLPCSSCHFFICQKGLPQNLSVYYLLKYMSI